MCASAGRWTLGGMGDTRVTITLELCVEGDTFSGRATTSTDQAMSFAGWLGLLSAIDALVSARDNRQTQGGTTCSES